MSSRRCFRISIRAPVALGETVSSAAMKLHHVVDLPEPPYGAKFARTENDDARLLLHVALRCAHRRDGHILEEPARDAGAHISTPILRMALAIASQDLAAHPDDGVLQRTAALLEEALHRTSQVTAP